MTTFPNEKPIPPHDLIAIAEEGRFQALDEALDEAGLNLTRRDFDFTESGRSSGNTGVIVARPRTGQGDHWALDERTPGEEEWHQRPGWDPSTNKMDLSSCPVPPPLAANLPPPPPLPGQAVQPVFSPFGAGRPIRMTGNQADVIPDVGSLGKGDDKRIAGDFFDQFEELVKKEAAERGA
ncbi:MAG: hypothetical protein BWY99_01810 [Synergistetes bacterium ADurb.BinA166]|nr:MAG: hypothetical protein BWY99_01810 [Synergistetes bacterium ADurb.BinA166]